MAAKINLKLKGTDACIVMRGDGNIEVHLAEAESAMQTPDKNLSPQAVAVAILMQLFEKTEFASETWNILRERFEKNIKGNQNPEIIIP